MYTPKAVDKEDATREGNWMRRGARRGGESRTKEDTLGVHYRSGEEFTASKSREAYVESSRVGKMRLDVHIIHPQAMARGKRASRPASDREEGSRGMQPCSHPSSALAGRFVQLWWRLAGAPYRIPSIRYQYIDSHVSDILWRGFWDFWAIIVDGDGESKESRKRLSFPPSRVLTSLSIIYPSSVGCEVLCTAVTNKFWKFICLRFMLFERPFQSDGRSRDAKHPVCHSPFAQTENACTTSPWNSHTRYRLRCSNNNNNMKACIESVDTKPQRTRSQL